MKLRNALSLFLVALLALFATASAAEAGTWHKKSCGPCVTDGGWKAAKLAKFDGNGDGVLSVLEQAKMRAHYKYYKHGRGKGGACGAGCICGPACACAKSGDCLKKAGCAMGACGKAKMHKKCDKAYGKCGKAKMHKKCDKAYGKCGKAYGKCGKAYGKCGKAYGKCGKAKMHKKCGEAYGKCGKAKMHKKCGWDKPQGACGVGGCR